MAGVSVLGTGLMGTALARAFLAAGHSLVVWNRTAGAMAPLVEAGARPAATAAEALGANPLSVVCVRDYAAATSFLEAPAAEKALQGKTLVQLSTGTTREARDAETWARRIGCGYLDGKVKAYPEAVGRDDTLIYVSGNRALFEAHRASLAALGGRVTYLGEPIAYSAARDVARLTMYFAQLVGFLYSLRLCREEGYPFDDYVADATNGMPPHVFSAFNKMARAIENEAFDESEATVDVMAAALDTMARTYRDAGVNSELPDLLHSLFARASAAGLGKADTAALVKILGGA